MGETSLLVALALAAVVLSAANCVLLAVLVAAVCGKVGAIEFRWPVWRWMWSRERREKKRIWG